MAVLASLQFKQPGPDFKGVYFIGLEDIRSHGPGAEFVKLTVP